jgi:hypothetical protein
MSGRRPRDVRDGMRAALLVCASSDGGSAAAQTAEVPPASPNITIAAPPSPGPVSLQKGWTFRFDAPATCIGCGDRPGPPVVNGNTPWRASGALNWQSDAGAVGVRLTGQRGARLPLFMTPSVGLPMPAAASDTLLSETHTQWQVTLSGERTLWRIRGGASLSLFGDLHLPLGAGRTPDTGDVPTLSQTAFLAGFRVRF